MFLYCKKCSYINIRIKKILFLKKCSYIQPWSIVVIELITIVDIWLVYTTYLHTISRLKR